MPGCPLVHQAPRSRDVGDSWAKGHRDERIIGMPGYRAYMRLRLLFFLTRFGGFFPFFLLVPLFGFVSRRFFGRQFRCCSSAMVKARGQRIESGLNGSYCTYKRNLENR